VARCGPLQPGFDGDCRQKLSGFRPPLWKVSLRNSPKRGLTEVSGVPTYTPTLGGSVDTVYTQIARIGGGDLYPAIPIRAGLENTVLGWLSAMQAKLNAMNRQRQQAEEALRVSEERLKLFIQYAPAGLAMFDRDMRYL